MNDIERLKKMKDELGLSYDSMAREIGITPRTLFRWLKDEHEPSIMGKEKINQYLRTSHETK